MSDELLIIGNGFDISLDAKTKYSDFYEAIETILLSKDLRSASESLGLDSESFNLMYKYVNSDFRENYFLNYFHHYGVEFGNWVDFEAELCSIVRVFDFLMFNYLKIVLNSFQPLTVLNLMLEESM